MQLGLLFADELRGFYKSKVMIFLWIGLPVIALLFRFISAGSTGQDIPFTLISRVSCFKYRRHISFSDACSLHNQREKQACLRPLP